MTRKYWATVQCLNKHCKHFERDKEVWQQFDPINDLWYLEVPRCICGHEPQVRPVLEEAR